MSFMFGSVFWGVVLILAGVSIVLKAVFHIYIPVFRIVVAGIIIYFGVRLLLGNHAGYSDAETIVFRDAKFKPGTMQDDYSVIFGKGTVDLRELSLEDESIHIEVSVIFGSADVLIDPEMPLKIESSTVFGDTNFPRGSSSPFGDSVYRSPNYSKNEPHVTLETNAIFGGIRILR